MRQVWDDTHNARIQLKDQNFAIHQVLGHRSSRRMRQQTGQKLRDEPVEAAHAAKLTETEWLFEIQWCARAHDGTLHAQRPLLFQGYGSSFQAYRYRLS